MDTDLDFFMIITDRVADEGTLKLPPGCSQRMRDLPENILLRDRYKNVWPVKISKTEAVWYFDEGWMELYNDNSLQVLDCLQFAYKGGKLFDFQILGSDGCDKEGIGGRKFVVNKDEEACGAPRSRLNNVTEFGIGTIPNAREYKKTKNPDCYGADIFNLGLLPRPTNPYFVSRSRAPTKPYVLHIPHQVIKDHNLNIPAKFSMVDEKGQRWSSKIRQWHDGRLTCSKGWTDLCKTNEIEVNTLCIFEFVQGNDQKDLCLKVQQVRK